MPEIKTYTHVRLIQDSEMLERMIYTAEPGETLKPLSDGRTIIAHPAKHPRVLYPDGKIEQLTRENCPEVWLTFESAIKQILRPN